MILGASADKRFGVAGFPAACRAMGLTVVVDENILEASNAISSNAAQQERMGDLELGGYNQRFNTLGHDFTMFTINKPITSNV